MKQPRGRRTYVILGREIWLEAKMRAMLSGVTLQRLVHDAVDAYLRRPRG